jgi:hypothetical protein
MKIRLLYFAVICLGAASFLMLISATPDQERLILGEWKEVKWEYEKVNLTDDNGQALRTVPEEVKKSIGQHLVIHEAETWTFYPNGTLRLKSELVDKEVKWCMKGRGNILQIRYANNSTEHYVVNRLKDGSMCLQFDTDVQARGIAKLVFERN